MRDSALSRVRMNDVDIIFISFTESIDITDYNVDNGLQKEQCDKSIDWYSTDIHLIYCC